MMEALVDGAVRPYLFVNPAGLETSGDDMGAGMESSILQRMITKSKKASDVVDIGTIKKLFKQMLQRLKSLNVPKTFGEHEVDAVLKDKMIRALELHVWFLGDKLSYRKDMATSTHPLKIMCKLLSGIGEVLECEWTEEHHKGIKNAVLAEFDETRDVHPIDIGKSYDLLEWETRAQRRKWDPKTPLTTSPSVVDLETINKRIDALQDAHNAEVATLTTKVDAQNAEAAIATLTAKVDTIHKHVEDLEKFQTAFNGTAITTFKTLADRINAYEQSRRTIAILASKVFAITTNLASLQASSQAYAVAISNLNSTVDDLNSAVTWMGRLDKLVSRKRLRDAL